MRVEMNTDVVGSLNVKRFYVPGCKLFENCPKCRAETELNLEELNYISYPSTNAPAEVFFCCEKCDHNWAGEVIVRISIEPVSNGGSVTPTDVK